MQPRNGVKVRLVSASPRTVLVMQAKAGDTVQVHYTGRLNNGVIFDSSEGRDPLSFQLGSGMVIAGFDAGLMGMAVGESKTVLIPVADAYGPADENLIFTFPKSELPQDMVFEVGMQLNMHSEGQEIPVTVANVTENEVIVDANHPLAGHELTFDLTLVSVK